MLMQRKRNTCLDRGRCPLRAGSDRGGISRCRRFEYCNRCSPMRVERPDAHPTADIARASGRRVEGPAAGAETEAGRPRRATILEFRQRHEPALPDQQAAIGDPERQGEREGVPSRDDAPAGHRIIEWKNGKCVRTLVSQYVAYLDGRIEEVALDFYAQADDGSVWYFGEDVYNYAEGVIRDTSGTWLAGKEGPAAMIMPAVPKVGEVHRPENIPGLVFEEVAVKAVDKTMAAGPRGAVRGALVGRELHDDGTFSDKVFAPGYGEFFTAHEGDVEALALAVPTAALAGAPAERA